MTKAKRKLVEQSALTIDDVADYAGVSSMTVSRVLRGTGNVSAQTTDRVQQAMDELGYVPNRIASSLAAAKATQIAVLVPTLESTVFTEVLSGINAALDGTPYQAIIGITDYDPEKELSLIRSMLGWRPAGFIVAGSHHLPEAKKLLKAGGVPVVEVMELTQQPIDMCVGVNQHAAGAAMATYMVDAGYKRFAYLGADHAIDRPAKKRFKGFNSVLEKKSMTFTAILTEKQNSNIGLGKLLMQQLLASKYKVDAIYCSNDSVAVGALLHCLACDVHVPDDVAIASFSGLDIALAMPVPITTVASPRRKMGATSAEMIMQRINGKKTRRVVDAGFELLFGESC